jgi:dTDP-4-amino-4,6-dideoxygalactose transaminase
LRDEILARIAEVVDAGRFILGPHASAFETEFADYIGAEHAVGVANGTDAITIALRAMGVGPGDEDTRAPRRSRRPGQHRCSATSTWRHSA